MLPPCTRQDLCMNCSFEMVYFRSYWSHLEILTTIGSSWNYLLLTAPMWRDRKEHRGCWCWSNCAPSVLAANVLSNSTDGVEGQIRAGPRSQERFRLSSHSDRRRSIYMESRREESVISLNHAIWCQVIRCCSCIWGPPWPDCWTRPLDQSR